MASRLVAAASFPPHSPAARFIYRRGFSDYWPNKVNMWEELRRPMMWKTSHFVVASIALWGGSVYCGLKLFDAMVDKKPKMPAGQTNAK